MIAYALSATKLANNLFEHIVNPLIVLLGIIALIILLIVAIRLMAKTDSTDKKDIIKQLAMVIFGIFILFSVWSIFIFVYELADSPSISPPEAKRPIHVKGLWYATPRP